MGSDGGGVGSKDKLSLHGFSTSSLPEKDRHEAWLYRDWPSIAPAYRTTPTEPFDVTSERLRLDDLVVQYASFTGQEWVRDHAMLRSFDADALGVAITLEGDVAGDFEGRDIRAGAGTVQMVDMAKTSAHISSASKTIHVIVPRATAIQQGLDVASLHGAILDCAAGRLLGTHLLGIRASAPELPEGSGKWLARGVLDLLSLAVASTGRGVAPDGASRDGIGAAARTAIERELGSASFNVARLCQTLGISRSTLHRLFEEDGGVQAFIRGRRLEAVRSALSDATSREPLHMLADRLGFSDSAHLSRLFRSRYGMTPTDFRHHVRNGNGLKRP